MLASSLRASRQTLARAVRQSSARTFMTTSIRKADLVQDLYLKELKAYKAPAVKASDSDGHVQKFAVPQAPASPEEADLAKELSSYESQVPEIEGQAEDGAAAVEEDWFVEEPEEDEAHH